MKTKIVNLTNHLIKRHRYQDVHSRINNSESFVEYVRNSLQAEDVGKMSPAKLGEIVCALGVDDVLVSKEKLFSGINFTGDFSQFLREFVSLCLAYVIRNRLCDAYRKSVPPYEGATEWIRDCFSDNYGD